MEDKSKAKIIVTRILIGIFITIAVRYGAEYVYSTFRKTGLTPELPYSEQRNGVKKEVDIYLIPFDGFPETTASQLANILSQDLNLNIETFLSIALDAVTYNESRKQYVAESLAITIAGATRNIRKRSRKTAYIGLLNDDMYPSDEDFNYLFSIHFKDNISVIATSRLIPFGVFDRKKAQKIYGDRLLKIIKRTIGQQYFGKKRSSKRSSLMYSPLLGPDDIDKMSF